MRGEEPGVAQHARELAAVVGPLPAGGGLERGFAHRVQFRAEAFNAFKNVNFADLQLSMATTATFGQFAKAGDGRVMQFGLRYEF